MNVVDLSACLSYFAGDENAEHFAGPIEATGELLVPRVTMTEVFKNVLRQRGEETALIVVAHMEQGAVVSLDEELAINAAYFAHATAGRQHCLCHGAKTRCLAVDARCSLQKSRRRSVLR